MPQATPPSLTFRDFLASAGAPALVEPLPAGATADDIAAWIQRRIAGELGVEAARVRRDVAIPSLGLPSVAALTITADLCEAIGRDLPDSLFWDQPSLDAVARLVARERGDPSRPDALRRERAVALGLLPEEHDALFEAGAGLSIPRAQPGSLLHAYPGGDGSLAALVWVGGPMAGCDRIAEQTGLRMLLADPGFRVVTHDERVVLAMAAILAGEVAEALPAGTPLVVGGYCFGAKVALEAARLLAARGWPVRQVVVVEYPGPSQAYDFLRRLFLPHLGVRLLASMPLVGRSATVQRWLRERVKGLDNLSMEQPRRRGGKARAPLPRRHWEYAPRPFDLPVTLVFGRQSRHRVPLQPCFGWRRHIAGARRRVVLVGGAHLEVFQEPHVPEVATLLRAAAG